MNVMYSHHAEKRLKERGMTKLEVEHILKFPIYVKKSIERKREAVGEINGRTIKVVFIEKENYIKVITVI